MWKYSTLFWTFYSVGHCHHGHMVQLSANKYSILDGGNWSMGACARWVKVKIWLYTASPEDQEGQDAYQLLHLHEQNAMKPAGAYLYPFSLRRHKQKWCEHVHDLASHWPFIVSHLDYKVVSRVVPATQQKNKCYGIQQAWCRSCFTSWRRCPRRISRRSV